MPAPDEERAWFRLRDDQGATWTVGIQGPALPVGFAVGEEVHVDYHHQPGGWSQDAGHLTVRASDGALLFWYGRAGYLAQLTLPEGLSVARGAAQCAASDDCGRWKLYALELGFAGAAETVSFGEVVSLGEMEVVHGMSAQQDDDLVGVCPDWFIADYALALRTR